MRWTRGHRVTGSAAVVALALAGCTSSEGRVGSTPNNPNATRVAVAMITHGEAADPFWAQVEQGAKQAASDFNVDLAYQTTPGAVSQAEADLISAAVAKKPAALIATIPEAKVLVPAIKKAADAGIPVVIANAGAAEVAASGARTYVGQDESAAGEEAGREMADAGVKRGVCLIHEEHNQVLTDRCAGFDSALKGGGGSTKIVHISATDTASAEAALTQELTDDPSIDGVLATGIQGYAAASTVLDAMASRKVTLGAFDVSLDPNNLDAVTQGKAAFVIDQQPFLQGYLAVQVAAFEARFGQHPAAPIYTGPSLVTKDNAAKVLGLYQNLGKAPSGQIAVSMVTHGQNLDPFWALVRKGAEQAASDFHATLSYASPAATDPQAQAKLITDAVAGKPAAMVVTDSDPAVLDPAIRDATAAGMPVVIANVGADKVEELKATTYVGQDESLAGEDAASAMADAGVKNALCVIHEAQNKALTDRCDGFTKELTAGGGKVTTVNIGGTHLQADQETVEAALAKDAGIDGILATGIQSFSASGGALQARGLFGKVKLGTFDISLANLQAVQSGQTLFVVDQQPFLQGYLAVQTATFAARYGQSPYAPIYTGPSMVTADNIDKVLELYRNKAKAMIQRGGYPN
ncbi:MAG: substrate-binding domain-containing protein [Tetrasphaera sp.]